MHAVMVGQLDHGQRRYPRHRSRYIEDSFDGNVVALWSSGAAGDQNPIYFQQTYDLREIRIKDYAERGIDISNAMPPGGEGLDRKDPTVIRLMNQQKQMILSMGQFLGEEVLHVMRGMDTNGIGRPDRRASQDRQLPGPRAHEQGSRRLSRRVSRGRRPWRSGSACSRSATS